MLETFPQVFCFPKSRINENGGNIYIPFKTERCHWLTFNLCLLLKPAFFIDNAVLKTEKSQCQSSCQSFDFLIRCVTASVSVESNFMINIPTLTGNAFKSDINYFKQEGQI